MGTKKIVFALNTEFCLLVALQYLDKYLDETYEPIWVLLKSNERFATTQLEALPGKILVVDDHFNTRKLKLDTAWSEAFKGLKAEIFVMQNNYKISSLFLLALLKKTNPKVTTVFISDSIALDVKPAKRIIWVNNVYLNFRRFMNGFFQLPMLIVAADKFIDRSVDIYISKHKNINIKKQHIAFKDMLSNIDKNELCNSVFPFDLSHESSIYFFTQPILEHNSFSKVTKGQYIKVLTGITLLAKKNKIKVLIKVHPSENLNKYLPFENDFCKVFKNNSVPAEVLFTKLKNKKIVSCFSSISTLDFSGKNTHFWFYPLVGHQPSFKYKESDINVFSSFSDLKHVLFMDKK